MKLPERVRRAKHSVRCADCRWWNDNADWCFHPVLSTRGEYDAVSGWGATYNRETVGLSYEPVANANGDCPYYERKWWKLWRPV